MTTVAIINITMAYLVQILTTLILIMIDEKQTIETKKEFILTFMPIIPILVGLYNMFIQIVNYYKSLK